MDKIKTIKEIAQELLDSDYINGYGIRCDAIQEACIRYGFRFVELYATIIELRRIK